MLLKRLRLLPLFHGSVMLYWFFHVFSDKLVKWILIVSVSCLKKIYFGKQSAQATKIHLQAIQKLSMKHMKSYLCQDAVSLFSYHMLKVGGLFLRYHIIIGLLLSFITRLHRWRGNVCGKNWFYYCSHLA